MKSFKSYNHKRILTAEGEIANGDYILESITVRIKDGYISDAIGENGEVLPGIETHDGSHIERWQYGVLSCDDAPAVIDSIDNVEEWWKDGLMIPASN